MNKKEGRYCQVLAGLVVSLLVLFLMGGVVLSLRAYCPTTGGGGNILPPPKPPANPAPKPPTGGQIQPTPTPPPPPPPTPKPPEGGQLQKPPVPPKPEEPPVAKEPAPVSPTQTTDPAKTVAGTKRPAPGNGLAPLIFKPVPEAGMWETWWTRNRLYYLPFKEIIDLTDNAAAKPADPGTMAVNNQGNKKILDPLVKCLKEDKNPYARANAAIALAKYQDKTAAVTLQEALKNDANFDVRNVSSLALGIIGDETAIPELKTIMLGENTDGSKSQMISRAYAALALGYLKAPEAREALKDALAPERNLHPEIQCSALISLGNRQDISVVPFLGGILNDPARDESVRSYAALALGKIKDPAALPELRKALKDKDANIRASIAIACGLIRVPNIGTKNDLIDLLKNDKSPEVCGFAALALASIFSPSPALGGSGPNCKTGAAMPDAGIYPTLAESLKKNNYTLHGMTVLALGILGDPRALPEIRTLAEKKIKPLSRGAAILALGLFKDKDSVPMLVKIVDKEENSDPVAWTYALQALGMIGDVQAVAALDKVREKLTKRVDLATEVCNNVTVSLALLGKRKDVLTSLYNQLKDKAVVNDVKKRVIHGIGYLGDKNAVEPLISFISEEKNDDLRAEAILALGFVLDKDKINPLYQITADNNFNIRLLIQEHIFFSGPE